MLSKFIKLILFLSSYSPVFFIFTIQNPFKETYVRWILFGIGILSILALFFVLKNTNSNSGHFAKVNEINSKDGEAMSYIVTYLVPFLGLNFSDIKTTGSLLILFGVLAILYVNSNLIYTNPILNLFSYHIYEIQIDNSKTIMLITKKNQIMINETIEIKQLDNNIYTGSQN